jgi:hypothetical protein
MTAEHVAKDTRLMADRKQGIRTREKYALQRHTPSDLLLPIRPHLPQFLPPLSILLRF